MAKKSYRRASPLAKRVEEWLELPMGSVASTARIELSDNRRAVIEGCQGLLEYDDTVVRFATGSGAVRLEGMQLSVSCMDENAAVVSGQIVRVEWEQ